MSTARTPPLTTSLRAAASRSASAPRLRVCRPGSSPLQSSRGGTSRRPAQGTRFVPARAARPVRPSSTGWTASRPWAAKATLGLLSFPGVPGRSELLTPSAPGGAAPRTRASARRGSSGGQAVDGARRCDARRPRLGAFRRGQAATRGRRSHASRARGLALLRPAAPPRRSSARCPFDWPPGRRHRTGNVTAILRGWLLPSRIHNAYFPLLWAFGRSAASALRAAEDGAVENAKAPDRSGQASALSGTAGGVSAAAGTSTRIVGSLPSTVVGIWPCASTSRRWSFITRGPRHDAASIRAGGTKQRNDIRRGDPDG